MNDNHTREDDWFNYGGRSLKTLWQIMFGDSPRELTPEELVKYKEAYNSFFERPSLKMYDSIRALSEDPANKLSPEEVAKRAEI